MDDSNPAPAPSRGSAVERTGHRRMPAHECHERDVQGSAPEEEADEETEKPVQLNNDEEEAENIDSLIEELESEDGHGEDEEEREEEAGGGRSVPEDILQTDRRSGLTEAEVTARRRKFGPNQMKEEQENLVLKFLGYFVGPIQFVMEVRHLFPAHFFSFSSANIGLRATSFA